MPMTAAVQLRHHALFAAVTAGTMLWALTGCGEEPAAAKGSAPAWEEPSAYRYTLESSAGKRSLIGTFDVTVRDGKVVKAVGVDEGGQPAVEPSPGEVPTIGELLRQAETAREEGADVVDVEYAGDGRPPVDISIDWEKDAIDDEASYAISDYEALG